MKILPWGSEMLEKRKYKLGFDLWGALLFAAIMLPNGIWFLVPAPADILRNPSVTPATDAVASVFTHNGDLKQAKEHVDLAAKVGADKVLIVPVLGYTLDMGNFAYSDEDVTEAYELLKPYIAHVHCKDRGVEKIYQLVGQETDRLPKDLRERPESMKALPDDAGKESEDAGVQSGNVKYCRCCQGLACVPTGGGYLPIRELVIQLISQGYDGYLAIEHFDAPDQFAYMRRSAEFLKSICQRG